MKKHKQAFLTLTCLSLLGLLPYFVSPANYGIAGLNFSPGFLQIVRNFLPDFLWATGFAYTIHWLQAHLSFSRLWLNLNLTAALLLAVLLEFAQHRMLIPGTADFTDCLMYLAGIIAGTLTFFVQFKHLNTPRNINFS